MRRPDLSKWQWLALGALLLMAGVATAATLGVIPISSNSDGVILNKSGGPTVNLTGNFDAYNNSGGINSTAVRWNTSAGNATFVSNGSTNVRLDKSDLNGQWTNTTNLDVSSANLTVNPGDKEAATAGGSVTALRFQQSDGIAIGDSGADFVYSASGSGTITLRNLPASTTFHAVANDGTVIDEVTTDSSGHGTIQVRSGSSVKVLLINADAPVIKSADPKDSEKTNQSSVTLSVTMSDQDFDDPTGDSVTINYYLDGSVVETKTVSSNGTYSVDVQPSLGENHTWHADLRDKYDKTDSIAKRTIQVPAELRVYYETQPEKLVDGKNVSLRVRFFGNDSITTRNVTNGVANLSGLPVEDRFVVTVRANDSENFTYRRIVVEDLYETQRVFLLRANKSSSQVVFELQDPTGNFPPGETTLFVEKPLTINNTTSYYTIAGDTFGATGRFPAVLQDKSRYRLRVVSNNSERILGAYTVYGATIEPLKIQRIEPAAGDRDTGAVYGSLTEKTNESVLAVRFRGGESNTTVTYVVKNATGDVVVPETTVTGKSFAHMYTFNKTGRQSYNVSYTIEREDGSIVNGSFIAGKLSGVAGRFNIDAQVMSILSWGMILATLGLIVIVDRRLAPAAGTGMASALTIIGTVAIPAPVLGIAGAISVFALFGGRS